MMKKTFQTIALLLCLVIIGLYAQPLAVRAAEADIVTVEIDLDYGQTEARNMLQLLNDFRTGTDAWAWDSSNSNQRVAIDILSDKISITAMECSKQSLSSKAGKSVKLPEVTIAANITGHWPNASCPIVSYISNGKNSLK